LGQKVHPLGLRLGIIEDWRSRWFATKEFSKFLEEDIKIRRWISRRLVRAAISKVEIERSGDRVKVDLYTARPGVVIGKRGAEVDLLRAQLEKMTKKHIQVNIQEVSRPELNAMLVAQSVAEQLSARVAFRRAMKKAVTSAMKSGASGIKITCSGRLGGSEMARTEWYREGRVPLHTLRARVDYGFIEAPTTFGRIGVKVWIYLGEVFGPRVKPEEEAEGGLGLTGKRRPPVKPAPAKIEPAKAIDTSGAAEAVPAKVEPQVEAPVAPVVAAEEPKAKKAEPKAKAEEAGKPIVKTKAVKEKAEVKPVKEKEPEAKIKAKTKAAPKEAEAKKAPEAKKAKPAAKAKPTTAKAKKQEGKDAPTQES